MCGDVQPQPLSWQHERVEKWYLASLISLRRWFNSILFHIALCPFLIARLVLYIGNGAQCVYDVMVYIAVLETVPERGGGSSPPTRTKHIIGFELPS